MKLLTLFKTNSNYFAYRIPVLFCTKQKTLIAICEGRKNDSSDYATIDLVIRRMEDGRDWSEENVLRGDGSNTYHNAGIIVDGDVIHLFYGVNYLRIFHAVSYDDGKTFTQDKEITSLFTSLAPSFTAIAVGPGTGVIACNKLLIPTWIALGSEKSKHANSFIATLYSENHGKDWNLKRIDTASLSSPNESMFVTLSDGRVMINVRHMDEKRRRITLESNDGIDFYGMKFDEALTEQRVMASIIRTNDGILFSNPAYCDSYNDWVDRKGLAIRLSEDGAKSWQYKQTVCKDWSGYSHLAYDGEKYYILYETNLGEKNSMDLVLGEFDIDWLKKKRN